MIITGHQGFIGSVLTQEFEDFWGIDKGSDFMGEDILSCDLRPDDLIIHLAAQSRVLPSIENPVSDAITNVIGTARLAQYYSDARFIFTSTEGCIQKTIESPYGLSKKCAEDYIKFFVKDHVILRLPNIYGRPGSGSVIDKFIDGPVVINGDGTATRDYVHVEDVARAIKMAIDWPPGTYHLGSDIYHSVLELAKATGKKYTFGPAIEGEQHHTETSNTTPDWEPQIDVMDYLLKNKNGRR